MNKYYCIVGFFGTLLFIFSCNNQKDPFESDNKKPEIKIANSDNIYKSELTDSIKLGLNYDLSYKIVDENIIPVRYQADFGDSIVIDKQKIVIKNYQEGLEKVYFITKDPYKFEDTATLNLYIFKNLGPVCNYTVSRPAQYVSVFQISIDASESYDKDQRWGGKIVEYKYKIENNSPVIASLNKFNYIFATTGSKKITVSVKDNEGKWSDEKTIYYMVTNN